MSFTPRETGDYYVYVTDRQIETVTVYGSGSSSRTFDNVEPGIFPGAGALPGRAGRLPWKTADGSGTGRWRPRSGGLTWTLWQRFMRS